MKNKKIMRRNGRTILIKSFCGCFTGAVFPKSTPPGRRRQIEKSKQRVYNIIYLTEEELNGRTCRMEGRYGL
jgi:hypothetical protein